MSTLQKFQWSFSRDALFRECPRKYYMHYIVPRLSEAQMDVQLRRNIIFLRNLTNRHLLLGKVLHSQIARIIDFLLAGKSLSLERAIRSAWEEYETRLRFSRQRRYLYGSKADPYYTVLFEDVYGIHLGDTILGQLYKKLKRCLRHLYVWEGFSVLQELDRSQVLQKEELALFEYSGTEIWVKLDLLFRKLDGTIRIIDWKLSDYDVRRDILQLALYGFYGKQKFARDSSAVFLQNFYLSSGKLNTMPFDEELEKLFREYLNASLHRLREFHRKVNAGWNLANIHPQYREKSCPYCAFRKICFPDYHRKILGIEHSDYFQNNGR